VSTRLKQDLDSFERAFAEQAVADRVRAERLRREAIVRTETRHRERRHKHGSLRFVLIIVVLLATAVGVTLAMFQALFLVMG
jgi:anti-sigma-K factor RskA